MCLWLAVSTSGFYGWIKRPQSDTAAHREQLAERIHHFFEVLDRTYGYRRIHADLACKGTECSPEFGRQIMHDQGQITQLLLRTRGTLKHRVANDPAM